MACFATPYGLHYAAHCFNRAYAQNNRPALIPAGGKLGVTSLAVRLCRRLGARAPKLFQHSSLEISDDATLVLAIEKSHAPLYGLGNEKDLVLLADRLALEPQFRSVNQLRVGNAQIPKPVA